MRPALWKQQIESLTTSKLLWYIVEMCKEKSPLICFHGFMQINDIEHLLVYISKLFNLCVCLSFWNQVWIPNQQNNEHNDESLQTE